MTLDQFGGFVLGAIPCGVGLWQLMTGKVITSPSGRSVEIWDKDDYGPDLFFFSVLVWIGFGLVIWWAVFIKGPEQCRQEQSIACRTADCLEPR